MPYISPALSPTKAFSSSAYGHAHGHRGSPAPSPPNSGPSSPSSSTPSSSARNSAVALNTLANAQIGAVSHVAEANAAATGPGVSFSGSSSGSYSRPGKPARRHSRSLSSDALVQPYSPYPASAPSSSSSGANGGVKATPEYIFVHPASPLDEDGPTPSTSASSSSSPTRPPLRSSHRSSHTALAALGQYAFPSPSEGAGAGDQGDVAPPRTSRRGKKFHLGGGSPSTSPSSRNSVPLPSPSPLGRENAQTATATATATVNGNGSGSQTRSSPSASLSTSSSPGQSSSSGSNLPLPRTSSSSSTTSGDGAPPAFANRSSSSPALLSMAEEASRQLGASSPSGSSSTATSSSSPGSGSSSATTSADSSFDASASASTPMTTTAARDASPSRPARTRIHPHQLQHPHSHSYPHPSGSPSPHPHPGYLRSTDLPPDDSALATSSESASASGSASGSDTEPSPVSPTYPSSSSRPKLGAGSASFTGSCANANASASANGATGGSGSGSVGAGSRLLNARRSRPSWDNLATPTMGGSTSFSFGNNTTAGTPTVDDTSNSVSNGHLAVHEEGAGQGSTPTPRPTPTDFGKEHLSAFPMGSPMVDGGEYSPYTGPLSDAPTPRASENNNPVPSSSHSTWTPTPTSMTTTTTSSFRIRRPGPGQHARTDFRLDLSGSGSGSSSHTQVYAHPPLPHHGHQRSFSHRPPPLPTPMLRKKSGELVKSSMKHDSRAKSAPTTPTGPKAVHFDEQLERVKLFLAQQRPLAVSRDGSPIETETEDDSEVAAFPFPPMTTSIPAQIALVLPDFPHNALPELGNRDVCLEALEIAADWKSLKGTCLLRNLAFEKRLSIRFTLDDWQTVSEVTGEWASTLVGGTVDRWAFTIKLQDMLARIEERKMFIAIRYQVAGRELWDNNHGKNYLAEFRKSPARKQAVVGGARAARHEWSVSVTNPGQASERMADLRRELDRLVADRDTDDESLYGGSSAKDGEDGGGGMILSPNPNGARGLRYVPRYLMGEDAVPLAQAPATTTFSSRYDFGASLKNEKHLRSANNSSVSTYYSPQLGSGPGAALASGLPAPSPSTGPSASSSNHAILDNPYFASPNATETMISSWRTAAASLSPPSSSSTALSTTSPPKPSFSSLYADDSASVLGGSVSTFSPANAAAAALVDVSPLSTGPSTASTIMPPPASFSGNQYFPQSKPHAGVTATDFGMPNYMNLYSVTQGTPVTTASPLPDDNHALRSFHNSLLPKSALLSNTLASGGAEALAAVPVAELLGGAPLARQARFNSFPPGRSAMKSVAVRPSAQETMLPTSLLDPSLDDQDPLDARNYSPAEHSPTAPSPPRRASPPPSAQSQGQHSHVRPSSPEDLLSPSPSSASTDTSISTPQSPNGSPPLKSYAPYMDAPPHHRPDMGSDTYFNFVHRYCWGNGDPGAPSSVTSSSSSSTSTALGLAGLSNPFDPPSAASSPSTPRRVTPPSSCSASLLSSPTQSNAGSRTPSPKNLSPAIETVARMEQQNGFLFGPPTVRI